jgi:hypothetical protein
MTNTYLERLLISSNAVNGGCGLSGARSTSTVFRSRVHFGVWGCTLAVASVLTSVLAPVLGFYPETGKSTPFIAVKGITGLEQEVIEFDETLDEELILKVLCLRYRP